MAASELPPVQRPREDDSVCAARILALASETADRYVKEAKAQADQMVADAKTSSERLLSEAQTTCQRMVAEARCRADSVIGDARTHAETMEREIRATAAALGELRSHVESWLDGRGSAEPSTGESPVRDHDDSAVGRYG